MQGTPGLLQNEIDVTQEFLGFWKNFMEAFELEGSKVVVAGESYAGYYIPYIADAMLNANDTRFFNVDAAFSVDPIVGNQDAQQQVPHRAMTREFPHLFPFNETFEAVLAALDQTCGFTAFLDEYLVFPPKGIQPPPPTSGGECDMFDTLIGAMYFINPCFSTYHITSPCPYAVDPVTNPPGDGVQYFNRPDVKTAINAPPTAWRYRGGVYAEGDQTTLTPLSFDVLPRIIERLNKMLIVSGNLDLTLPTNGTVLAIQNMTWNGALGFRSAPARAFFIPRRAGTDVMGTLHAERGLSLVDVYLAGHQLLQWQPAAAFRQLEFVLGRVESMGGTEDWTVTI
ncbi:Alpha/Beta hydrolase protein [Mycena epipterygia]|nr:Alpha/Beta hydrolase protein [Mycena epipterygia]